MEHNELATSPTEGPREPWTLQHGFYAQMGGFVLDTVSSTMANRYSLPQTRVRLDIDRFVGFLGFYSDMPYPIDVQDDFIKSTLSQDMKPVEWPSSVESLHITAGEIADKSNGNGLAKTLVCMQSIWFCIQCVARLAQHLPLSLLEISTAAHALAAVTTYLLWWHKPLDIERPTSVLIESERDVRLWASAFQKGRVCFGCLQGHNESGVHHSYEGFELQFDRNDENSIQE